MTIVWTALTLASALYAMYAGSMNETVAAMAEGAGAAVRLGLGMLGSVMLWSGLLEVMDRSGLTAALSRALRPVLDRLFPSGREDEALAGDLAVNLSANLLGLGNAATPAGIRAAVRLRDRRTGPEPGGELCRLVVLNTASVQLLPVTVAALRSAAGSAAPFDILPGVWAVSLLSVSAGLLAERLLRGSDG